MQQNFQIMTNASASKIKTPILELTRNHSFFGQTLASNKDPRNSQQNKWSILSFLRVLLRLYLFLLSCLLQVIKEVKTYYNLDLEEKSTQYWLQKVTYELLHSNRRGDWKD